MKKGDLTMVFLVSIIILTLSLVIITLVWQKFFSKAESSAAESLCMGFNAVRMRTKVEQGRYTANTFPNTCKTLDKTIPSDIYPQTKEGAMEEMRNLVAKCWWMFLEGAEKNMFAKDLWMGQDPCFTCYRFNLKGNIKQFTFEEFKKSLEQNTYLASIDGDFDDCAPIGGGTCIDDVNGKVCSSTKDKFKDLKKSVYSTKCKENQHCCISGNSNECENKGGKCIPLSQGQTCESANPLYSKQYDKWACRTGTCCIGSDNYYSYLDYIQSYRGDGAVIYEKDLVFKPAEEYAITFISPRPGFNWEFLWKGGLTGAGTLAALFLIPGGKIAMAVAGTTLVGGSIYTYFTSNQVEGDINTIFISKLDSISNTCEAEPDITE
jgi:hypothetical protein